MEKIKEYFTPKLTEIKNKDHSSWKEFAALGGMYMLNQIRKKFNGNTTNST